MIFSSAVRNEKIHNFRSMLKRSDIEFVESQGRFKVTAKTEEQKVQVRKYLETRQIEFTVEKVDR